jgi:hypothetical protein
VAGFWPVLACTAIAVLTNAVGLWGRFGIRRPFSSRGTAARFMIICLLPGAIVVTISSFANLLGKPATGALAGLGASVPYWVTSSSHSRSNTIKNENRALAALRRATDLFTVGAIDDLDGRLSALKNQRCKDMNNHLIAAYVATFRDEDLIVPCIDPLYNALFDWVDNLTGSEKSKDEKKGRLAAAKKRCGEEYGVRPLIEAAYDWRGDYVVRDLIRQGEGEES